MKSRRDVRYEMSYYDVSFVPTALYRTWFWFKKYFAANTAYDRAY